MFLFTTPNPTPQVPANPVVNAIRDGADKTGTGFDFLLKTAQRESALDPNAKARTSSATGLFQFIEQTWLSTLKSTGSRHGLQAYSDAIQPGDSGRLTVSDPAMRDQILALRKDPKVSAVMAGEFTQKNRDQLASAIGRTPTAGDLYAAHVLGARGATDLIRTVAATPTRIAAQDFPEAAAANRGIFYDKSGQARTAQEVYGMLAASHAGSATTATASAPVASDAPVAIAAALAPGRAKGLIGLFSTEGSRGPVSEHIAKHWTTSRSGGSSASTPEPGQRFFPRAGIPGKTPEVALATVATATILQDAPTPPARPTSLSPAHTSSGTLQNSTLTQQAETVAATVSLETTVRPKTRRSPLDLRTFLNTKERS
jgi:hypothetical protein